MLARRAQAHAVRAALEQAHVQHRLQPRDLVADGRGGQVQFGSGQREAAAPGHGLEGVFCAAQRRPLGLLAGLSRVNPGQQQGAGELAALLGPTLVGQDKSARVFRLREVARQVVTDSSPEQRNWIEAYTEATNTFLTPTKIGFGVNQNASSPAVIAMTLYSWDLS